MSVPNKHGGGAKNLQEKYALRHAYLEPKSSGYPLHITYECNDSHHSFLLSIFKIITLSNFESQTQSRP